MQRTYNTGIINCSKGSNALYIRLTNTSSHSNAIALTIYDYSNPTPRVAYNSILYVNPKSIKSLTLPLMTRNYEDCFNIEAYGISYITPNHFIHLSYKELYIG
ncbi:MAG: hypothetical protein Q4B63_11255 [Clostridium perfringens]|nr:hypothetical protein [Clostridium perfringens]